MTQVEKQIEQLQTLVGGETSDRFEQKVASAVIELACELKQKSCMDNDAKMSYATHIFAQMLDDLALMVEQTHVVN